ncbi:MAG: hypothetical protein WBN17_06750, partial [Aureibaculum sp.]
YTTSAFEKIHDLSYNCDYGSLTVQNAKSVVGNGDYLTVKLGSVSNSVKIDADYGSIRIENLMNGFKSVDISSSYTGIKIGIPENASFNFELQLSYAGFKRDEGMFNLTKQIVKSSSKYYEGYANKPNSDSFIKINSDYGSVSFY